MPDSIVEYRRQLEEWKVKYGVVITQRLHTDLTLVSVPLCVRCTKHRTEMNRHHKANDYFFAKILPDVYAARYVLFLDEDVAWLCKPCHKLMHRKYHPIIDGYWQEFNELSALGQLNPDSLRVLCDKYRALCLKRFEDFIRRSNASRGTPNTQVQGRGGNTSSRRGGRKKHGVRRGKRRRRGRRVDTHRKRDISLVSRKDSRDGSNQG